MELRSSFFFFFHLMLKWALFSSLLNSLPSLHEATNLLSIDHSLREPATLNSPDGVFHLGFFTAAPRRRYVGIWHGGKSLENVVWVANRQSPITTPSASLSITADGNIAVLGADRRLLWSSNATLLSSNSTAELSDFGNLMLNNSGATAWQSFDHPSDTYLPGMKIGVDLTTNSKQLLTSWKSPENPSLGEFSLGVDPSAQLFIWEGGRPRWRSGQWNGQVFIGIPDMVFAASYGFKLSIFADGNKMYYYTDFNSSHRWVLSPDGTLKHLLYFESSNIWINFWEAPGSECDKYNRCGNYGSCTDGAVPICSCLKGYRPRFDREWSAGNWSGGCVRRRRLQCEGNGTEQDGFFPMKGMKLPDTSVRVSEVVNVSGCGEFCLRNCSCRAYSFVDSIGCMIWEVDLADLNVFNGGGNDLYLRLAAQEFIQDDEGSDKKKAIAAYIIVIIVLGGVLWMGCISFLFCKFKRRQKEFSKRKRTQGVGGPSDVAEIQGEGKEDKAHEIPPISFRTILAATDSFSNSNFLGRGGFGPVYKGTLSGGQEIAVKRLSRGSGQGMEEFKNEVILIAKLQHRNLVRLLGFCTENEDQILVYEYMPNKSLDSFIFDPIKKGQLDWKTRYSIIEGIARGLLYLHRDSRLRIIHRDLKASNILLDAEMNPKISDFGLARIFGSDNNETSTRRVVGTYGYMSPEYAMQGLFSIKSDVFSFGVLLLEIISGKKNSTYRYSGSDVNLLAYAWMLWNEENVMELVDPSIRDACSPKEVSRCINLGLLCVQDRATDRPTMPSVIVMLESGVYAHSEPKPPTFAFETVLPDTQMQSSDGRAGSVYEPITNLTGR